ncbi:hypothetical protein [Streptomyces sp. NPDC002851]
MKTGMPEKLAHHFAAPRHVLLTLRTGEFTEQPHIGQPYDHQHRMGLLLATLCSPLAVTGVKQ